MTAYQPTSLGRHNFSLSILSAHGRVCVIQSFGRLCAYPLRPVEGSGIHCFIPIFANFGQLIRCRGHQSQCH